jgi:hypothetical protein
VHSGGPTVHQIQVARVIDIVSIVFYEVPVPATADVFGAEGFSEGTLDRALDECSQGLSAVEEKIKEDPSSLSYSIKTHFSA